MIPPAFQTVYTRDGGLTCHAKTSGKKPYRTTCMAGEEAAATTLVRMYLGAGYEVQPDKDNGHVTSGATWNAWKVVQL